MQNLERSPSADRINNADPIHPRQARWRTPAGLLTTVLCAASLAGSPDVRALGETTAVSVNGSGQLIGSIFHALPPAISADGRFTAFSSEAPQLVGGDTNHTDDVFVHDRQTARTRRVSVSSTGNQGNGPSLSPALSADGRYVAFYSGADNLVPDDTNYGEDVFVHDLWTRQTTRISGGSGVGGWSGWPTISANGRFVAFLSSNSTLVPGDTNQGTDIFVHDLLTHQTQLVSTDSAGNQGVWPDPNWREGALHGPPALSANGRFVTFWSQARNLVGGDTNRGMDVFVHDLWTHRTTRVSVDSAGNQVTDVRRELSIGREAPAISADGRFVAFPSYSNNLVPGSANRTGDIFIHDRLTQATTRLNATGIIDPGLPSLSADGRFVAFDARDPNTNPIDPQAYVHDRLTNETLLASVASPDSPPAWQGTRAYAPALSADGRFVAFSFYGRTLVPAPNPNGPVLTYVRDRLLDRSATADLGITQTAEPTQFVPLSPLTYTLTAVNHGPDAATDVTVNDRPALLSGTVLSVTPSQGSCSQGAPFVCYLGTLAPDASSTITVTVQPQWRDTVSLWNTAQVNAAPVDGNRANNQSTLRTDVAP